MMVSMTVESLVGLKAQKTAAKSVVTLATMMVVQMVMQMAAQMDFHWVAQMEQ